MVELRNFKPYFMENLVCKLLPIKSFPQGGPVRTFGFLQKTLR